MTTSRWVCASPPTPRRPHALIHSAKPDQPLSFTALAEELFGLFIHFLRDENRSFPCFLTPCSYCTGGLGKMFRGYLAGLDPARRVPIIAEHTVHACRELGHLLDNVPGKLRGRNLTLHKANRKKAAPVCVTMAGWADLTTLPPAFDVVAELEQRWGVDLTHLRSAPIPQPPPEEGEVWPC
jgi:hypothetical protein